HASAVVAKNLPQRCPHAADSRRPRSRYRADRRRRSRGGGQMKVPSLKSQIRNGTLLILLLLLLISAYALPRVYQLGGAIKQTLYRNYLPIECAQRMQAALRDLQLAERSAQAKQALPVARTGFRKWMRIEDNNFTEQGEPELANDIESHAEK